jgi:hypothetical protein
LNWSAASRSRTTAAADIARPKRYDARLRSCLLFCCCLPDAPRERSLMLIAAAASFSLAVYSYPLPLALLLLLRARVQDFQLMLNTELLISYVSIPSFSVLKIRPTRLTNYSTLLSILCFRLSGA